MALVSGEKYYSSPEKRIKLDQSLFCDQRERLSNSNVELDCGEYSAPLKKVHEVIKGQYTMSAASGYNEIRSVSCNNINGQSGSSEPRASSHSPAKEENSTNNVGNRREEEEEEEEEEEDDEKDEMSSTVSNLSNLSGLSELSGQDWKPMAEHTGRRQSAESTLRSSPPCRVTLLGSSLQSKHNPAASVSAPKTHKHCGSYRTQNMRPMSWIQKQMLTGVNPRSILNKLMGICCLIPPSVDDLTLWKIIASKLSEPPRRRKLRRINTLLDVVRLLKGAKKIIVLTGAGVSVSCGIPDFRSRNGIYSRLALDFPDLPGPQAMFDIHYFNQDPRPFFKFAREIYPGQFKPSPCHRFIKMLEKHNKLLRNYSQNIDTLEQVAGIQNVIECHGSFATASCTRCKYKVTADAIRDDIFGQRIPLCPQCSNNALPHTINNERSSDDYKELVQQGIMKPDIVFFGEGLLDLFHESMTLDKDECDLLIVIGSSLRVRPVSLIPRAIPANIPQILINREPVPHCNFDVRLFGNSDVIINQLCHMLGEEWTEVCWCPAPLAKAKLLLPPCRSRHSSCEKPCGNHYDPSTSHTTEGSTSGSNQSVNQATPSIKDTLTEREDQSSNVESSEADSPQMNIEIGMRMSADSCCSTLKERHTSVDVSMRDSGICFSAESTAEHNSSIHIPLIDLSKDYDQNSEARFVPSGISSSGSSRKRQQAETAVDSSSRLSPADSTMLGQQYTVLMDSSSMPTENTSSSNSGTALLSTQVQSADSSCCSTDMTNKANVSSLSEVASVKYQQVSLDSMNDTRIEDSTNCIDSTASYTLPTAPNTEERCMPMDSMDKAPKCKEDIETLRACWQPKVRESLAARLPENSYYFMQPSTYIFPGAEVYYEPTMLSVPQTAAMAAAAIPATRKIMHLIATQRMQMRRVGNPMRNLPQPLMLESRR